MALDIERSECLDWITTILLADQKPRLGSTWLLLVSLTFFTKNLFS